MPAALSIWGSSLAVLLVALSTSVAQEPLHQGKPVSAWADELVAYSNISQATNPRRAAVKAMRELGTNAIPWLLSEMAASTASNAAVSSASLYIHQNRARFGFWALAQTGAAAIPDLLRMLEQQPEFVPWALAGIGARALPALELCLTNAPQRVPPYLLTKVPGSRYSVSALAALFVSLKAGRIGREDAARLIPVIRAWAADTNETAAYWARGVLSQLEGDDRLAGYSAELSFPRQR